MQKSSNRKPDLKHKMKISQMNKDTIARNQKRKTQMVEN